MAIFIKARDVSERDIGGLQILRSAHSAHESLLKDSSANILKKGCSNWTFEEEENVAKANLNFLHRGIPFPQSSHMEKMNDIHSFTHFKS